MADANEQGVADGAESVNDKRPRPEVVRHHLLVLIRVPKMAVLWVVHCLPRRLGGRGARILGHALHAAVSLEGMSGGRWDWYGWDFLERLSPNVRRHGWDQ